MKIVDVDIRELQSASNRGRRRSSETQELIDAIGNLGTGQAKAVIVSNGDDPRKLRSRLNYAARIAGKRLQIVEKEDRVLFTVAGRARRRRRKTAENGS